MSYADAAEEGLLNMNDLENEAAEIDSPSNGLFVLAALVLPVGVIALATSASQSKAAPRTGDTPPDMPE